MRTGHFKETTGQLVALSDSKTVWAWIGLLLAAAVAAPFMLGNYQVTLMVSALIAIIGAVGLNMLTGTTGFSMAGFSLMPLAESTAFLFVTPLVVVILSHWLLKESITRGHWIAVLAGFGGALLIARPGGALNAEGIVWMTLAAACYAIYQIQTRQLSPTENTLTMLFYTALVGTVAMTLAAPLYWGGPTPGWIDAALIASLGIYGGTGHLMLTRAFRYAAASFLSPFLYGQLIWAGLLGWMFYDHLPDLLSIAGMVVIAGSSLSIALGERLRRRA